MSTHAATTAASTGSYAIARTGPRACRTPFDTELSFNYGAKFWACSGTSAPTSGKILAGNAPALNECYLTDGHGAFLIAKNGYKRPIRARALPSDGAVVVASRNHRDATTDEFIARHQTSRITSAGSALKFGLLAKGAADLYPRFGRTMEWDTAAGHAVLTAAGGSLKCMDGTVLRYGKEGLDNPAFIARGVE